MGRLRRRPAVLARGTTPWNPRMASGMVNRALGRAETAGGYRDAEGEGLTSGLGVAVGVSTRVGLGEGRGAGENVE